VILALDETGQIHSDQFPIEVSEKVLDLTKENEETRNRINTSIFTGRFLSKRLNLFDYDTDNADLFNEMGIGDTHEFDTITSDPSSWLKTYDRIVMKGTPPSNFDSGTQIRFQTPKNPSKDSPFIPHQKSAWHVCGIDIDEDSGEQFVTLQLSHQAWHEAALLDIELAYLQLWLTKLLADGSGYMTLSWIGQQWVSIGKTSTRVLFENSKHSNLKDFIKSQIEPSLEGELSWRGQGPEVAVVLKSILSIEEEVDEEYLARLWISAQRKIPEDPIVAAHTYLLVKKFIESEPDVPISNFIHHSWPDHIAIENSRHQTFGWRVWNASIRNPQYHRDEYEMLNSTVRLLKIFEPLPEGVQRNVVVKIAEKWKEEVIRELDNLREERLEKLSKYTIADSVIKQHRGKGQTFGEDNEEAEIKIVLNKAHLVDLSAESKGWDLQLKQKIFFREFGPLDSPRRVADLLNALDNNPKDITEFTELVKNSYRFSTATPWTRLLGREKMLKHTWSIKNESHDTASPSEVIYAALVAAGKTSEEVEEILSEASKFRPTE